MNAPIRCDGVDDLQHYLRAWSRWTRAWRAPLGYPTQAPFVRAMPATPAWGTEDSDPEVDGEIMRHINSVVEGLSNVKNAAVRLIYLRETMAAVFQSTRMPIWQVKTICQEAEVEMVPKLRARGVILGGY